MGISILGGKGGNFIEGLLSTISGDLHIEDIEGFIAWSAPIIDGAFEGTLHYYGDIDGELSTVGGDFWVRNAASIEGELSVFAGEGLSTLTGSSNCIALEGELFMPTGVLTAGGEIVDDLALMSGVFTGTVPSVGRLDLVSPLVDGELTAGGEIIVTSIILSGDLHAVVPSVANISGASELSMLAGSFSGSVPIGCEITGTLRMPTGVWTGHTDTSGGIQGTQVVLTGEIHGLTGVNGDLTCSFLTISGYFTGFMSPIGDLVGDLATLNPTPGFQDAEEYQYRVLRFVRGETR